MTFTSLKIFPSFYVVMGLSFCLLLGACATRYRSEMTTGCVQNLSPGAQRLVADSMRGLDPKRITDYHTHLITNDINPKWRSWAYPKDRIGSMMLANAAGVHIHKDFDEAYLKRFAELIRSSPIRGKVFLFAFDKFHDSEGRTDDSKTVFHVPNDAVFAAVAKYPDLFVPVVSIHPYRADAIAELERCARLGSRYVKWIPNSMGMDPASPKTDAFYRRMRELHMTLISHAGFEPAVETNKCQEFGNPLRLRKPLDMGVRVIAAHCASWGRNIDLDAPGHKRADSFDLFLRLMDEPAYRGRFFGDISAITFLTRGDIFLLSRKARVTLLERPDIQERLVYGSDYPICAVGLMTLTSRLAQAGFITQEQRKYLNEIRRCNPWLFNFVLNRTIRDPKTGRGFADSIFQRRPELR